MNIPAEQVKSLEARGFNIAETSVVMHGKTKLTVAFDGWVFSKDLTTASPRFIVINVEKPESKPRKPKTGTAQVAKTSGKK